MLRASWLVVAALTVAAAHASAEEMESFVPVRTARILCKRDRFEELDAHIASVISRGAGEGIARDPLFMIAWTLHEQPAVAHLDSWCAARPGSPFAHTLRGRYRVQQAWEARGEGPASSVTPEGWEKFRERIALAKKDLERAHRLAPTLPHPVAELVRVAMAESDEGASKAWFEKGVGIDPRFQPTYENRMWHLQGKWGGSDEAALAFARKHGKADPRHALLIVHLHFELSEGSGRGEGYYDAQVRAEIEDAFARYAKAFPRDPKNYDLRVQYATRIGDEEAANEAYDAGARVDAQMALTRGMRLVEGDPNGRGGKKGTKDIVAAANAGHWFAQLLIAKAYQGGIVKKVDPAEALKWFELAAECDELKALINAGYMYQRGIGTAKNEDKALDYLLRAGLEGEVGPLRDAARILTTRGEWARAEALMKRLSEHGPDEAAEWFVWCKRQMRGDVAAALAFAKSHTPKHPPAKSAGDAAWFYQFFLLAEDARFSEYAHAKFRAEPDAFCGLNIAVETDDADERRELLEAIEDCPDVLKGTSHVVFKKLAALLRESDKKGAAFDAAPFEALRAKVGADAALVDYFLGRLLERRGERAKAKVCYERATASPEDTTCRALAKTGLDRIARAKE